MRLLPQPEPLDQEKVLNNWEASFADLRRAELTLQEWLKHWEGKNGR